MGDRTGKNHNNCPYCSGRKVCFCNSLAKKYPKLALEWHPTKNKKTAAEVTYGSGQKVWWKCREKHKWEAMVCNRSLRNNGCPKCFESHGERQIRDWLEEKEITYIREYVFPGVRFRMDFFLPDHNGAIEFDGVQHFEPVGIFGGEVAFQKLQERDKAKDLYCSDNHINFLRIHHLDREDAENLMDFFTDWKSENNLFVLSASYK